jgi:hypothetical protein
MIKDRGSKVGCTVQWCNVSKSEVAIQESTWVFTCDEVVTCLPGKRAMQVQRHSMGLQVYCYACICKSLHVLYQRTGAALPKVFAVPFLHHT